MRTSSWRAPSEDVRRLLQKDADDAWLNANELSALAGRAHYNREGERVNAEKDKESMVTVVLRAYAEKRGLQYADEA